MLQNTMVLLIGIQGSGKTTFYREQFSERYEHVSLDVLNTRYQEKLAIDDCFEKSQDFVVDNTNPTQKERERYISLAKKHKWRIVGYYLRSSISECIKRNEGREGKAKVPEKAIKGTARKLELPSFLEGFDELFYVRIDDDRFIVLPWSKDHEV